MLRDVPTQLRAELSSRRPHMQSSTVLELAGFAADSALPDAPPGPDSDE
jgi:hypothetical protein